MRSNFYVGRAQKRKKYSEVVGLFYGFGICPWKMLVKSTPGVNFINIFMSSFYARSFPKRKNSVKSSESFYAFGICMRKSIT